MALADGGWSLGLRNKTSGSVAILIGLFMFLLTGCASKSSTALVDKQYQRTVQEQQRKSAFTEDTTEFEKKLSLRFDPEESERMGDVYNEQGNLTMAFVNYSKALQADPGRLSARQKTGYLLLKRGLWKDAVAQFDIVLEQAPGNSQALQGRGNALLHLDRIEEAEQALIATIKNDAGLWRAHALLGIVYDRQKRYEMAVTSYEKAIAINPHAASVYNNLGLSLSLTGRQPEAADAFLKALNLDPSSSKTYNNLGVVLFKMQMYPEAVEAFSKGGDEGTAYNNMGILYSKEKQYEKAIISFEKAIKARPVYYGSAQANLEQAKANLKAQQAVQQIKETDLSESRE